MDGLASDKVFNLQLTVQRLEEELGLYRNGTTASELLSVIAEKDREVDALTKLVLDKTDKLRRLKQTSHEVLLRCEQLERDLAESRGEASRLSESLVNAERTIGSLSSTIQQVEAERDSMEAASAEALLAVDELEQSEEAQCATIDKLQARCAAVLADKMAQARAFEQTQHELTAQLNETAERALFAVGERLQLEQRLCASEAQLAASRETALALERRVEAMEGAAAEELARSEEQAGELARLGAALSDATRRKGEYADMLASVQERVQAHTEMHRAELAGKDAAILRGLGERDELRAAHREDRDRLLKQLAEGKKRLDSLEGEQLPLAKREIEVLKMKNRDLEARRKEDGRKSVPLGDRTNAPTTVRPPSSGKYAYEAFSSARDGKP